MSVPVPTAGLEAAFVVDAFGRVVELDQHGVVEVSTEPVLNRWQVGNEPVGGERNPTVHAEGR